MKNHFRYDIKPGRHFIQAIAAGVAGGGLSYLGQRETNSANAQLAADNQAWQEYMSNTAHVREVADLKRAGLNPILSANKGASTPSGNLAKMENALGTGVTSAIDSANLVNQIKGTSSTIALQQAQGAAATAQANQSMASAKQTEIQTTKENIGMNAYKKEAEVRAIQADYDKKNAQIDAVLKRVVPGTSAIRNILPGIKIPLEGRGKIPRGHGTFNKKTGEIYE